MLISRVILLSISSLMITPVLSTLSSLVNHGLFFIIHQSSFFGRQSSSQKRMWNVAMSVYSCKFLHQPPIAHQSVVPRQSCSSSILLASDCPGWFVLFHGFPVSGYKHDHGVVRGSKWCTFVGGVKVLPCRECDNLWVFGEILHTAVIDVTSQNNDWAGQPIFNIMNDKAITEDNYAKICISGIYVPNTVMYITLLKRTEVYYITTRKCSFLFFSTYSFPLFKTTSLWAKKFQLKQTWAV